MQIRIRVVRGSTVDQEVEIELPAAVGRSRAAQLKLGHSLVSRKHCELFEQDGAVYVRDLESLNGTYVGRARIAEPTLLAPGATFSVGPVTMRVDYESAVPLPPPASDEGEVDLLGGTGLVSTAAAVTTLMPPPDDAAALDPVLAAVLQGTRADEEPPLEFDFGDAEPVEPSDAAVEDASGAAGDSGVDIFAESSQPPPVVENPTESNEPPTSAATAAEAAPQSEFALEDEEAPPAGDDDGLSGFLRGLE